MSDLVVVRQLVESASASLEANRERLDDLNVYPVPDGDTGTNLALSVRAVVAALDELEGADRPALAHGLSRAALMGARGNSGVILSQIVRGAADVLGVAKTSDAATLARAFRAASDTAYRGVRTPVEGTMLTVIREMAEEAEARADSGPASEELLDAVLARGEDALQRTPELLDVLREAGVVDAGGAGLVELLRGIAASVAGRPLPPPPARVELSVEAIHRELSRFRYCTAFVIEGDALDAARLERELELLGDSLLVVGDPSALKVHVHTDDPGAALSLGTAAGHIGGVEIADMHAQTLEREQRLAAAVQSEPSSANRTDVVAVVAGDGNRRLYEVVGAAVVVEGGQSMNPSTEEIVAAIERSAAPEAIVLANNPNVIMSAEQAAVLSSKPVRVVPTRSIQAGLAALEAYDGQRGSAENESAMLEAIDSVSTAAVTTASRDTDLNGIPVRKGDFLGLVEGEPFAGGPSFDRVAETVVDAVLGEEHSLLTFLTGADAPDLAHLVAALEERHPGVELEVRPGGQPLYHLLIAAE